MARAARQRCAAARMQAGFFRYALPSSMGGLDGTNLGMAVIRDHLAAKGLGLHNDLQNESSVVGNLVFPLILDRFGTPEQKQQFLDGAITGEAGVRLQPDRAQSRLRRNVARDERRRETASDWVINGAKRFASGVDIVEARDRVRADLRRARRRAQGITAFIVDTSDPGYEIPYFHWTFNMPTRPRRGRARRRARPAKPRCSARRATDSQTALFFVHENRIRQAASGVGAADFCIRESVEYAKQRDDVRQAARRAPGDPVAARRARDRRRAAAHARPQDRGRDGLGRPASVASATSVSMCNYRANRLACDAADRAMQVHGGIGYTRQSRSSTSTATIAATGSPKARRRCRSATWPATCSDSSAADGMGHERPSSA